MRKNQRITRIDGHVPDDFIVCLRSSVDFDRGPDTEEDDVWVVRVVNNKPQLLFIGPGVISDCAVLPSGQVLLTGVIGGKSGVFALDSAGHGANLLQEGLFLGVRAIDDELVIAWGGTAHEPVCWRMLNGEWVEYVSQPLLVGVYGLHKDLVIATTQSGGVRRLRGEVSKEMPYAIPELISDVFIENETMLWAVTMQGTVLQSFGDEWHRYASLSGHHTNPMVVANGIVQWEKKLIVSLGVNGLAQVIDDKLVELNRYCKPIQIVGMKNSLITVERELITIWKTETDRKNLLLTDIKRTVSYA
ncbi:hypothetical protein KBD61_05725 [Patescibacteria group bacterium]|nr:hypothetical protein [Patescibacteria group bacterium]MBP9710487.1 hypothetical protein [Patescibacteria group bacterium]